MIIVHISKQTQADTQVHVEQESLCMEKKAKKAPGLATYKYS